jgi:HSP20 family protein
MTTQTASATQSAKISASTKQVEVDPVFDRMQEAYDAIAKRAFEIFENNGRCFGNELSDWLQAESELLHPGHLELTETDGAFTVTADVPGFAARELDIHVQGNRVTISGKHEFKEENTKGKTIYSERCAKEILRSVELPTEVDDARVNATLKDGVLRIELPKATHARSVKIEANSAD